jgi:hypothetical protein
MFMRVGRNTADIRLSAGGKFKHHRRLDTLAL